MAIKWTRRQVLGSALAGAASLAAGVPAWAAGEDAQRAGAPRAPERLTTGVAGDLTKPWRDSHDAEIVWTTFDTDPLQDRLFREASLDRTDFGVGFLVNSRATPNVAPLLQPLDDYRAKTPIEDFGDIAPGLVSAMTIGGKLIAVPFRTATIGLFYNEALLEEKGIKAPADHARGAGRPGEAAHVPLAGRHAGRRDGCRERPGDVPGLVRARLRRRFHRPRAQARARSGRDGEGSRDARRPLQGGCAAADVRHHVERRSGHVAAAGPRGVHGAAVRTLRTAQSPGPIEVSRTHQGGRVSDLVGTQREGADGVVRRILGDVHSQQCTRQGPCLELHPDHVEQGCHAGCCAQRQRTRRARRRSAIRVSRRPSRWPRWKPRHWRTRGFHCRRFPTRRARRRCSWRRCSSRCSAARRRRKRSPRSWSGSRR